MKIEWLSEARNELRELLHYYQTNVGKPYAQKFMNKTLHAIDVIQLLADFPEMGVMGVLKYDTLMGKYGFRALFIGQYVCVYKIEHDTVFVYHLADARKNYIFHIFGLE